MNETIVIGHKNPDTDSICSAYCYAALKNHLESHGAYIAGRCGNLNRQTRYVFEKFGITPPRLFADVYPRVEDIMTRSVVTVDADDPVFRVLKNIDELRIRILPVLEDGVYCGVVSIHEVTDFLVSDDVAVKPEYLLRPENFSGVARGHFLKTGERHEFSGRFMVGAMPFEKSVAHIARMDYEKTVLIVGRRLDIIHFAIEKQLPAIVVTGIDEGEQLDVDISSYKGWLFCTDLDTAETYRRLMMSTPVRAIMNTAITTMDTDDYAERARDILLSIDHRGLPVLRDEVLSGIITRSDLIKTYRKKLVLVDHNELSQAVDGADSADILEIIDHHRLGTVKTRTPITVYARPVGSTCTLVYELYRSASVPIDQVMASLLLSGIVSDTTIMRSPTTTDADIDAVRHLAGIAGIDPETYGVEMFSASESITVREPRNVIDSDFKEYSEFNVAFGIGQVEVVGMGSLDSVRDNLRTALHAACTEKGLHWGMLLVTDIVSQDSFLIMTSFPAAERLFGHKKLGEGLYFLPGVLSRKKQLLPEVLNILEELAGS